MSADGEDAQEEIQLEVEKALKGEDALVATADFMFQKLTVDSRFEHYFENVDLPKLATKLRDLLSKIFDGEEWPELDMNEGVVDECYEDFALTLDEALSGIAGDEANQGDALISGLDIMAKQMLEDSRLQNFFQNIRLAVATGQEEGEEEGFDFGELEEGEDAENAFEATSGNDINTSVFEELHLDDDARAAVNDSWRLRFRSRVPRGSWRGDLCCVARERAISTAPLRLAAGCAGHAFHECFEQLRSKLERSCQVEDISGDTWLRALEL